MVPSGSGLGMAVVWGTMRDHEGYIDVESTPGRGTTFSLYFPPPHPLIRPLLNRSHLFKFAYWALYGSLNSVSGRYWEMLREVYRTEAVWRVRSEQLSSVLKYVAEVKAHILILVRPNLNDPSSSGELTDKVSGRACGYRK
jgi:hypothetical protein